MTMAGCFSAFGVCAVRASELGSDGSLIQPNADGSAFDLSPVVFSSTAEVSAGQTFEQRDGCGNVCTTVRTPDTTTGYSGSLELCNQDFELIIVLGNGTIDPILEGGDTIGFKYLGGTPDPVEFNLWQQVYSGNTRASGVNAHLRHVLPYTQWALSDFQLEEGVNTTTLNFTSASTDAISTGSFNDFADELDGVLYARWLEAFIPDIDDEPYASTIGCGYINTPSPDSS